MVDLSALTNTPGTRPHHLNLEDRVPEDVPPINGLKHENQVFFQLAQLSDYSQLSDVSGCVNELSEC